jgi:hypothetical protein
VLNKQLINMSSIAQLFGRTPPKTKPNPNAANVKSGAEGLMNNPIDVETFIHSLTTLISHEKNGHTDKSLESRFFADKGMRDGVQDYFKTHETSQTFLVSSETRIFSCKMDTIKKEWAVTQKDAEARAKSKAKAKEGWVQRGIETTKEEYNTAADKTSAYVAEKWDTSVGNMVDKVAMISLITYHFMAHGGVLVNIFKKALSTAGIADPNVSMFAWLQAKLSLYGDFANIRSWLPPQEQLVSYQVPVIAASSTFVASAITCKNFVARTCKKVMNGWVENKPKSPERGYIKKWAGADGENLRRAAAGENEMSSTVTSLYTIKISGVQAWASSIMKMMRVTGASGYLMLVAYYANGFKDTFVTAYNAAKNVARISTPTWANTMLNTMMGYTKNVGFIWAVAEATTIFFAPPAIIAFLFIRYQPFDQLLGMLHNGLATDDHFVELTDREKTKKTNFAYLKTIFDDVLGPKTRTMIDASPPSPNFPVTPDSLAAMYADAIRKGKSPKTHKEYTLMNMYEMWTFTWWNMLKTDRFAFDTPKHRLLLESSSVTDHPYIFDDLVRDQKMTKEGMDHLVDSEKAVKTSPNSKEFTVTYDEDAFKYAAADELLQTLNKNYNSQTIVSLYSDAPAAMSDKPGPEVVVPNPAERAATSTEIAKGTAKRRKNARVPIPRERVIRGFSAGAQKKGSHK